MADPFLFLCAPPIRAATFIRHAEIHDELGSTNDRAAELTADSNIELPALIIAQRQMAGRGRGKNVWWAEGGALTFSVLLDTAAYGLGARSWPQLSLATGVGVCDALTLEIHPRAGARAPSAADGRPSPNDANTQIASQSSLPLAIKWPNDIILDGAKLAGILIESPGGTALTKDRLVIGIGVNVNNSWQSAPREAGPNGIALCDFTMKEHDLQQVLIGLLQALEKRINQLAASDPGLPAAWEQLSWLTHRRVEVQTNGSSITGICHGIDTDGALLIEDAFKTHRIYSGTVRAV